MSSIHEDHGSRSSATAASPEFASVPVNASDFARGVEKMPPTIAPSVTPLSDSSIEAKPRATRVWCSKIMKLLSTYWFPPLLVVVIGLAAVWPDLGKSEGHLYACYTIKYGAMILIFIIAGMTLRSEVIFRDGLRHWRVHLAIQLMVFGMVPVIGLAIGHLVLLALSSADLISSSPAAAAGVLDSAAVVSPPVLLSIVRGYIGAMCLPTAVSSNVVLATEAGGNEIVSVINSSLSLLIGMVLSPFLMTFMIKSTSRYEHLEVFDSDGTSQDFIKSLEKLQKVFFTIMLPLFVGQGIRLLFPRFVPWISKYIKLGTVLYLLLLVLVYSSFCDMFAKKTDGNSQLTVASVSLALALAASSVPMFMATCYFVSRKILGLEIEEAISTVFSAPTKALTVGLSLYETLLQKNKSLVGIYALPILLYHSCQLIWGTSTVPTLRKWQLEEAERRKISAKSQQHQILDGISDTIPKLGDDPDCCDV